MTKERIISFLRSSVLGDMVTHEQEYGSVTSGLRLYDPEFNQSDEELEEVLNLMTYRVGVGGSPIESIPDSLIHPLVLFTKRELYYKLAIKNAPLYDIESDTVTLSKGQRFNHYYMLLQLLQGELSDLESTGTFTFVETGEFLLDGKYYSSKRARDLAQETVVKVSLDKAYKDKLEISWTKFSTEGYRKFAEYRVYISKEPIVDIYEAEPISIEPKEVIRDIHRCHYRFKSLEEGTLYHIAIVAVDVNSLRGYSEIEVSTLSDESNSDTDIPKEYHDKPPTNEEEDSSQPSDILNTEQRPTCFVYEEDSEYLRQGVKDGHTSIGSELILKVPNKEYNGLYLENKCKEYGKTFSIHALVISNPSNEKVIPQMDETTIMFSISALEADEIELTKMNRDEILTSRVEFEGKDYTVLSFSPLNKIRETCLSYKLECREAQ